MLGLVEGCLLPATETPTPENSEDWIDKGDWLKLAHSLQAESVFFVGNEPVLVLAKLPDGEDEAAFFNRVWCMARPQLLFLAKAGELVVYKLSAPPVIGAEKPRSDVRLLGLAESAAEIVDKLAAFTRERIESGNLFCEKRFGTGYFRADRALVHDLKIVRRLLTTGNDRLSDEVAHALIGRALFVRYLEDRRILVREYFEAIAQEKDSWKKQLEAAPALFTEPHHAELNFFRVLGNREFTYAFFDQLTRDFNGDTFPVSTAERSTVKAHHLGLLRDLLTGAITEDGQEQLFLSAYRFEIVPIELISSIYEDFYTARQGKGNTQSSYYTPPALADFVLARALTSNLLAQRPRVMDASCGSGIFLVEAFRRIVRHRMVAQGRRLSQRELRVILRDQIRGIDLNPDAVPVAAFSLYLAYLHYQEPREINETRRLPNLRWVPDRDGHDPDQHFDILFAGNAFDAISHNDPIVRAHFGPASADIVVGNPPWGEVKDEDTLGRAALPSLERWLDATSQRAVGDNELSQAFVHLALELLADGGKAAMLVSSGVLFKQHKKSRAFRHSWLTRCRLEHVVNFAHVRHMFFADPVRPGKMRGKKGALRESEGTSPFISVIFEKSTPDEEHWFSYWSARRTMEIENTRAVVVSKADMHRLRQGDCLRHENLWKVYWWGGRRDEGLIRDIERFNTLSNICSDANAENEPAQGYTPGKATDAPKWFSKFKELPVDRFSRYGPISNTDLKSAPDKVHRPGNEKVFSGDRLLIKRGVGTGAGHPVVSRLERRPYLVSSLVNCFPLNGLTREQMLSVLGITWSSLAKYYFWLTASSWGMWHDEIQKYVACGLPIALPNEPELSKRIAEIVEALQELKPLAGDELRDLDPASRREAIARRARIEQLEHDLDDAIFDLYELNEADRDLVNDMCLYGLDFYYRRGESIAVLATTPPSVSKGLSADLPTERREGLEGYLQVFLEHWNADLESDGELTWEVIKGPAGSRVLAVLFSTIGRGDEQKPTGEAMLLKWRDVLTRLGKKSLVPVGTKKAIYIDTLVRAVSDHEILIVKRDEARLWTRSMAREDADATLARAMLLADRKS